MSASRTAIVTGASRGLGRALSRALVGRGWTVVGDGRNPDSLMEVADELGERFVAVPGDVTEDDHRTALVKAARATGSVDLVVNNASTLGASPLPVVADLESVTFGRVLSTNVVAPAALVREVLPDLRLAGGAIVNVSSDAAVEAYGTWGAYGASKAALDQLTAVLAVEEPAVDVYAVDPGDMRTDMHQAAFPGEDISDRPAPETSVPGILQLIDARPPSGRYQARQLVEAVPA